MSASNFYTSAHRITARDGLPETTIYSIVRDQKGFLWFGTPTSLLRFDGYEFREFSNEATDDRKLAVSGAGNIFIDSKNRLWVGTWGEGIVVYDENMNLLHHFMHKINTPGTLGSNKVQVVFEDSQGDIWIGTNGAGLSLYQPNDQSFINFAHDPQKAFSISHNRIWDITETKPGVLWIATSNGLNRLDTNVINRAQAQFIRYEPDSTDPATLNHPLIRSIHADKKGRLWVGSQVDFGLFDTQYGTFNKIDLASNVGINIVTRIKEDNDGNILVATQHGLYHYRPDVMKITPWAGNNKYQLFPQNDIRDVMVDKHGLLWVTTRFAGLIKIDLNPSSITPIETYQALDQNIHIDKVFSVLADEQGTLWLNCVAGLLYKRKGSELFERFELPAELMGKNITTMVQGGANRIWVGSHFGLFILDTTTQTLKNRNEVLQQVTTKSIQSLLVDSNGILWIGTTHDGLIKFDQHGELTVFAHDSKDDKSLSDNTILSLFEDNSKQIWVGTAGAGINRLDLNFQGFYHYRHDADVSNSISDNRITDIYQTRDGIMWFATPKSLEKLDYVSGNFVHFGVSAGLANNNIKALIEDNFGDLWVSSSSGISQFKRDAQTFHNFTRKAEVGINNFLPGVVAKNHEGKLFFGGTNGYSEVTPSQVKTRVSSPTTVITNMWVDNRRLPSYAYQQDRILELNYETKSIQLQFSSLDFHQPSENKYRYMLEGFDTDWREPTTNRVTSYTNLIPGEYTFKVIGSDGHNQWSEHPATLKFVIWLPFWKIWWVKVLMVITLLAGIYGWSIYRLQRLASKKKILEQQVALRTRELDESNKTLAQTIDRLNDSQNELVEKQKMASLGQMVAGIAHEVNTPLGMGITASSLLQQRIEDVKELYDTKQLKPAQFDKFLDEGLQNTGIIFRNLERAAHLINSFKQVAVDQSSKHDRRFEMAEILEETILSLSPKLRELKHEVVINCPSSIKVYSKPGPLTQVIINLVMNSINHAFEHIEAGQMTISVSADDETVTITYCDNGSGVSEELQKTIFDPFVTTKRGAGSTGLGMHVVYNIVTQALGGNINLNSEPDEGVEFVVVFPRDVREK